MDGNIRQVFLHTGFRVASKLDNRYDGDMCNFNPIFTEEARAAVKKYLNSLSAYLNSSGKLLSDPFVDTLERVLFSLSGDPV